MSRQIIEKEVHPKNNEIRQPEPNSDHTLTLFLYVKKAFLLSCAYLFIPSYLNYFYF